MFDGSGLSQRKRNLPALASWQRWAVALLVLMLLLAPAVALAAPDDGSTVYVVRRGDTLNKIAARFGVSTAALARANGIRNYNFVYVGQRLVIPGRSTTPGSSPSTGKATGGKWIDINLSRQRLTAYQGNKAVLSVLISSGTRAHPTVVGTFRIRTKLGSQTMSGPGYWLPGVPSVMYFYGGYAIHGTYWHHNFGRPMSHGCINMTRGDAAWLYRWAPIGTTVVTHY